MSNVLRRTSVKMWAVMHHFGAGEAEDVFSQPSIVCLTASFSAECRPWRAVNCNDPIGVQIAVSTIAILSVPIPTLSIPTKFKLFPQLQSMPR